MRVQNNNAQPNFGLKVQMSEHYVRNAKKNGLLDEAMRVKQWAEDRFAKDEGTCVLRHFDRQEDTKKTIASYVARQRAMASVGRHVENLREKYGINMTFLNFCLKSNDIKSFESAKPRTVFANLTNLAKAFAQIPHKEKYKIEAVPISGKEFTLYVSRGGHMVGGLFSARRTSIQPSLDAIKESRNHGAGVIVKDRKNPNLDC